MHTKKPRKPVLRFDCNMLVPLTDSFRLDMYNFAAFKTAVISAMFLACNGAFRPLQLKLRDVKMSNKLGHTTNLFGPCLLV